jgi:hypothetical protein
MATYWLHLEHSKNNRIEVPDSGQSAPEDFDAFFETMRLAFEKYLGLHPQGQGNNHELVILAYHDFMSETSPQFGKARYLTYRPGKWAFALWLLDRLQYFIADSKKLRPAMQAADAARARENAEAAKAKAREASSTETEGNVIGFRQRPQPQPGIFDDVTIEDCKPRASSGGGHRCSFEFDFKNSRA